MELVQAVEKAQQGDTAALTALCLQFRPLIQKHARQSHLAGIREDAESEAWLAFIQAVMAFAPERGVPFAGFAERCVHYRLWNVFKKSRRHWQTEMPLEQKTDDGDEGNRLLDCLAAPDNVAAEIERREQREILRQALFSLLPWERKAVTTLLSGRKLTELAAEHGVSVQAVYAARKRGLAKLRSALVCPVTEKCDTIKGNIKNMSKNVASIN